MNLVNQPLKCRAMCPFQEIRELDFLTIRIFRFAFRFLEDDPLRHRFINFFIHNSNLVVHN